MSHSIRTTSRPVEARASRCGGLGAGRGPSFRVRTPGRTAGCTHLGFAADDRAAVHAFLRAALAAGGPGAAGSRPRAFVLDADGCSVEAVHQTS